MAARAGVEPTTLQLKVIDSTNAPPHPTTFYILAIGPLGVVSFGQPCSSVEFAPNDDEL